MKILRKIFTIFILSLVFFILQSCQSRKFDSSKISMRPKIFMEGASPIPLFDEYDLKGVQLGTVKNIFSDNENDRVFSIWLSLDRRSSFYLQKETTVNLGNRLQLVANGQILGIHPIEGTISNGVLPFILSPRMSEEEARFLQAQLQQSIMFLQIELERQKK